MRSITSGGQDLEQHVNSEIKRMATVQPSASIANVGNGLEMLGAKIGTIGMKLQERKRAMDADRWQTDLQIRSNNILSNPDNVRAMNAGDYDKVRTELQKMYDDMNAKMETEYGITDKNTQFALGKVRDVLYGNTFASLNVKQVAWEDEKQKGDFTLLMDNKENLLISNMNSGDEVTAEANYQSFLKSNESALRDNLITPDQYQSNLRRIRKIRVTGKAEKMVENAYNNRDINELQRLSVELDHSDYIYELGGNGDERLGNMADMRLRTLLSAQKESVLSGNIRDDANLTKRMAQNSDDPDYTTLADKAQKAYDRFIGGEAWTMSLDRNGISLDESGTKSDYVYNGLSGTVENYYGKELFDLNFKGKNMEELINIAKGTMVTSKNGSRKSLWDIIDFSSDTNITLGDEAISAPNPVKYMKEQIDSTMYDLPYEARRKFLMDNAKKLGYDEFSVLNLDNTTPENRTGSQLESMVEYMQPNQSNIFQESDYEFQKKERQKEEKGWKEDSWAKFGIIFGIDKKYRTQSEYFLNLEGEDYRKLAYQSLVKRCNALMVKTNDEKVVQEAFTNGMDIIMGNDIIAEINDEKFPINKVYQNDINDIKNKGIELLKNQKVFQVNKGMILEVENFSKVTNVRANIYFEPLDENTLKIRHKAYGDLADENGELITIKLNEIRNQKIKEKQYQRTMPKNAISTPLSLYKL